MAEWLGVWILISRSWVRFRVAPDFFMMRRGSAHLVGTYRRCHVFVSLLVSTASVFLPVGKGWIKKFTLLLLFLTCMRVRSYYIESRRMFDKHPLCAPAGSPLLIDYDKRVAYS